MTTQPKTEIVKMAASAWKAIASALPLNTEQEFSSTTLAEAAQINQPAAGRALRFLRGLQLITYRSEYGRHLTGGQKVYMTRIAELDDGLTAIYRHFDAGRSYGWFENGQPGGGPVQHFKKNRSATPEETIYADKRPDAPSAPVVTNASGTRHGNYKGRVVVADERSTEEVRAIAGPEPEKPMEALREIRKDEPEALIEAARQYTNRGAAVQAKMKELAELGVTVDADLLAKAIHFETDERLETIAAILPLIDRLERQAARVAEDRSELIELRRSVGVLTKERNDLQAANRRLSERNVTLAAAAKAEPVTARA